MARDALAEIEAFNAPLSAADHRVLAEDGTDLTAEALRQKRDALASGPFRFFRGTFHLMARDVLLARVPHAEPHAPQGLIVGDLHLENYGAYRGASGQRCFDVNDFDDVGFAPLDFDLKRLCTSVFLLAELDAVERLKTAETVAEGWREGIGRLGGRFPVRPVDEPLPKAHEKKTPALDHPKCASVEKKWVKAVEESIAEWRQNMAQLKAEVPEGRVAGVAYRFRGTGSLGRLRFWAVLEHKGAERVVEIKESRESELDVALGVQPSGNRGRMQAASIRRLQGDPWPSVAGTHIAGMPALARFIEPDDSKIAAEVLIKLKESELLEYAKLCGDVLARLHVRESAPLMLREAWDPMKAEKSALLFAREYAHIVETDWERFARGEG